MTIAKTGLVVWHDLFTPNLERATAFFQRVAGWTFRTERAADFAWGGGEKDFVLALSGDEAGAGLAETPPGMTGGWIAYVEVDDVDAAAKRAETLGGEIVRRPFDVPGVGRTALGRDPLGALFGLSLSRHGFPAPRTQFGPEIHMSDRAAFPEAFYGEVLDWRTEAPHAPDPAGEGVVGPSGDQVAIRLSTKPRERSRAAWAPTIRVASPDEALAAAEALGARVHEDRFADAGGAGRVFLCEYEGAQFFLCDAEIAGR
ncbi:MAG: VOC family protein [Pseudomonadota bacterium]